MPITIDRASGTGGSPPTVIHVEGTKADCEQLRLVCSCNELEFVSTANRWSFDIPNDKNCPCGSEITITARCVGGAPSDVTEILTLVCDDTCCPTLTLMPPTVTGCAPNTAVASFAATLSFPPNCSPVPPSSFLWTLRTPNGKRFQRITSGPTTDTTGSWKDIATNAQTTVQFPVTGMSGGGTYGISVEARIPGFDDSCNPEDVNHFVVLDCPNITVPRTCPSVQGIVATSDCVEPDPAKTKAANISFAATVLDPARLATGVDWDFGDPNSGSANTISGAPVANPVTHSFSQAGTYTVKATVRFPMPCMQTLGNDFATITAVVPTCPCASDEMRDAASGKCVKSTPPPPTTPPRTSLLACDALLWLALILILLSGVLAIVGCLIAALSNPFVGAVIGYIALAILAVGLLLYLLWWAICRFLTTCAVLLSALDFMGALIAIFGVISVILGIIAIWYPTVPCSVAAIVNCALWGLLLYITYRIALAVGCLTANPSGPPPPATSSGGLGSSGGAGAPRRSGSLSAGPAQSIRVAERRGEARHVIPFPGRTGSSPVGLGDVITRGTRAMGLKPCRPCHERADALNRWVAFGERSDRPQRRAAS